MVAGRWCLPIKRHAQDFIVKNDEGAPSREKNIIKYAQSSSAGRTQARSRLCFARCFTYTHALETSQARNSTKFNSVKCKVMHFGSNHKDFSCKTGM